jgi:predicted Zn-dependent peptidase
MRVAQERQRRIRLRSARRGPLRIIAAVVLGLAFTLGAPSPIESQESLGERLPVREVTLENGLRVLLLPRGGAPTVSFVMQFGVGGVHERLGTTGIAHLLEHMLFKGTETIGTRDVAEERALFSQMDEAHDELLRAREAGDVGRSAELEESIGRLEDQARTYVDSNEFDRILTRAGARGLNATTTNEATIYFVELPANRAELFFALEADRMTNPVFREFYSERDVVIEERRMRVETSPPGALFEAHLAAAYSVHPYGVPVVGHMSDLETLSRAEVARYYADYYGPGNAVLAMVGNFEPDEAESWARRYLGPIPRGEEPPPVLSVEPEQRGERRVELEWDAEPLLRIGWHVPSAEHDDAAALGLLTSILTGGRTSRLHRRMVTDDRIATAVFSSVGPGDRYPRLFQLDVTPVSPATTVDLETAIYEEIALLASEGPSEEELGRVLNQVAAGAIRRLESNLGLAIQLANSESLFNDWRETFRSTARLGEVTTEDLRRVVAEYFTRSNRTVATLVRPHQP